MEMQIELCKASEPEGLKAKKHEDHILLMRSHEFLSKCVLFEDGFSRWMNECLVVLPT